MILILFLVNASPTVKMVKTLCALRGKSVNNSLPLSGNKKLNCGVLLVEMSELRSNILDYSGLTSNFTNEGIDLQETTEFLQGEAGP